MLLILASFILLIIVLKFTTLFSSQKRFKMSRGYVFIRYNTFRDGFLLILTGMVFDFIGEVLVTFNGELIAGIFFFLAYSFIAVGLIIIYMVMIGKSIKRKR